MGFSNGQMQTQSEGGIGGKGEKGDPGLPGIGFNLTDDGNFDIDSKRLTDVAEPKDNSDAATKNYVDTKNTDINSKAEKTDVILRDGTQSMKANLDMENDKVKNKIVNLANGTDNDDAVNLAQLKSYTDPHQNNYHLRESFRIYDKEFFQGHFISFIEINPSNDPNLLKPLTNHQHLDLYIAGVENYSTDFGGYAWSSNLEMRNDLPTGIYTVVFETFAKTKIFYDTFPFDSKIEILNDETLITQVNGDSNYKIITFSHDYQTTHSKAYIQFTSNGKPGKITFQLRYFGLHYDDSHLEFYFYSRVVSGKVGYAFDHQIFDVDHVQLKDQILYFDDIQMNDNKIKGLAIPTEDNDASNKKYVDDEIAKLPHSDNGTLKLDGSRAMTGDLNMGNHIISGIRSSYPLIWVIILLLTLKIHYRIIPIMQPLLILLIRLSQIIIQPSIH